MPSNPNADRRREYRQHWAARRRRALPKSKRATRKQSSAEYWTSAWVCSKIRSCKLGGNSNWHCNVHDAANALRIFLENTMKLLPDSLLMAGFLSHSRVPTPPKKNRKVPAATGQENQQRDVRIHQGRQTRVRRQRVHDRPDRRVQSRASPQQAHHATKDGIQEYELYLTKPDGIVIQVISEVSASYRLPAESAAWIKGVRVRGEGDGIAVKMIDKK